MKKFPLFLLLVCLSLITAVVFATSQKFINQGLVVEDGAGGFKQISNTSSISGLNLQTTTGSTMQLTTPGGSPRNVYFNNGSTNQSVISDGTW